MVTNSNRGRICGVYIVEKHISGLQLFCR